MSASAVHSLWTTGGRPDLQDRRAEDRVRAIVAHPDRPRRGDRRGAGRGVRAAQVPLLRPAVRRPSSPSPRPSPRSSALAAERIRHHQGAHRGDGRDRRRRTGAVPAGHDPAGRPGRRVHLRRAAPRPRGARQPRRLVRRAGRVRAGQRQREGRGQGRVHHHRGVPAAALRGRRHAGLPGGQRPADPVRRPGGLLAPAVPAVRRWPAASGSCRRRPRSSTSCSAPSPPRSPLFGIALLYGYAGSVSYATIAQVVDGTVANVDPALAGTMGNDALLLIGAAMIVMGLLFKVGAVPFHMWTPDVYQGAPDPGDRLHGGGDQGGRVRRAAAAAVRRPAGPALGLAAGDVGRRDRHHAGRRDRRDHPDRHQAAAGVLVDRARRLHPRRCHRHDAGRRLVRPLLPGRVLLRDDRRVRRGHAGARRGRRGDPPVQVGRARAAVRRWWPPCSRSSCWPSPASR